MQAAIVREAETGAGRRVFDLQLDQLGPYSLAFTRNGRHMLLGGRKGHLALLDWQHAQLGAEIQVDPFAGKVWTCCHTFHIALEGARKPRFRLQMAASSKYSRSVVGLWVQEQNVLGADRYQIMHAYVEPDTEK